VPLAHQKSLDLTNINVIREYMHTQRHFFLLTLGTLYVFCRDLDSVSLTKTSVCSTSGSIWFPFHRALAHLEDFECRFDHILHERTMVISGAA
jgi:hypothetical protein